MRPSPDADRAEPRSPTRGERKEQTRRAILDAALELCEERALVELSLRQVAKEVGIVPTAFYRHFESIEELGLDLVDESFVSLREMLRDVRRSAPALDDIIDASVRILQEHVHRRHRHFAFIARERSAGPPAVREAIRHEIQLCERELAADLTRLPGIEVWSTEDLHVLSHLIVTAMVSTAEAILAAGSRPDAEKAAAERARTQLRIVLVGALNWHSRP